MTTFLLLAGAMRGAWLWHRLIPLLQKDSDVIAYDLPGQGTRSGERAGTTMSTYIADLAAFIRESDLQNLILVGHSMSGIVISRIAEEVPERIRCLVYLAAVVPRDGDALIDLLPQERQNTLRKLEGKASELFGPLEALRAAYFTDLSGPAQDIYLKQLSPQPLAVFFEKVSLKSFYSRTIPRKYILGLRDKALPPNLTKSFAHRLGVKPIEIDAGHDLMVVCPEQVAEALLTARDF